MDAITQLEKIVSHLLRSAEAGETKEPTALILFDAGAIGLLEEALKNFTSPINVKTRISDLVNEVYILVRDDIMCRAATKSLDSNAARIMTLDIKATP